MNKRGISEVIATILIVLLVLAAVVIIWAFVRPAIQGTAERVGSASDCFRVEVEPTSCDATADTVTVQLVSTGGADVTNLKAVVTNAAGESNVAESTDAPGELGTRTITIPAPGNISVGDTASAAGVITITNEDGSTTPITCQRSLRNIECVAP